VWAWGLVSSLAVRTTGPVAYAAIEVVLDGVGSTRAVAFPFMNPANVQTKATHIEGFVTDAGCTVDIFALDYDRCTGAQKARVLAVGVGAGGANPIGRWRWDAGDLPLN
jgi:hypothetical protein